jgi:diguanylate cyclase (GGDEF)-like protein
VSLLANADRPRLSHPASSDAALASPNLTVILVRPRAVAVHEIEAMVREALPGEAFMACRGAAEALALTRSNRIVGRAATVFLFDFRGQAMGDLVTEIKAVARADPDAEFVMIADANEPAAFAACLQIVPCSDKLTFLLAPLHRRMAMDTIRSVAERRCAAEDKRRQMEEGVTAVNGLELEVQELRARLDIAKHAARHDDLTGALNRAGFVEELTARLARDRQHQNILMIDLDRFKAVNDTLGHSAGDDLVRKICTGIQGVLPPDAVLGRLGGDEFGVIVEAAAEARMASICTHILKVCAQTRYIMGHEVQVSASIGVAQQGSTHSEMELMRQADLALYAAKREGKNRCRVFDTALDKATRYRLSIENGLERALRSGQLKMVYQPIVKADDGAILGFEALIRWDSPDHGAISPAEFIPIAEETGLILDIGDWITRQALRDCRRWRGPYVSINLSTRQFLRHNVGERILRYAAEADVRPEQVQIELTETAIIDDVERAAYNLKIMRAAGVRVALDDFGTGYSSLTYLKQFAIDCIKIDKSFVDNITRDRQSAVIVASVSKLANSLGMSVVAEGVETEDQRRILIATGVKALQGFYFSKPVTAREAAVMLGRRARGQEGADAEADAERAEYARRGLG